LVHVLILARGWGFFLDCEEIKKTCPARAFALVFLSHRALSSVVEHFLHTEGVAGSKPAARTIPPFGEFSINMATRTNETSSAVRPAMHLLRIFLALVPFFITGCYTVNMVQCTIPDNPPNRVAATNIVASVAGKHELVGHPDQVDQEVLLASYSLVGDSPKRPLTLDVYADAGTITACVSQTNKKNKPRTEIFSGVERDLIKGFKEKFGSTAEINFSNEDKEP
jgi:hypothetical protein